MKNPEVGQKIRIIADSFSPDPHYLDIGSVHVIEAINPATSKEKLEPMEELLLLMVGEEPFDIPERVRVQFGPDFMDYANVPFEDFEIVREGEPITVKMTQDDEFDGFKKGDQFEAVFEDDIGYYVFTDKDGDERWLEGYEYEVL